MEPTFLHEHALPGILGHLFIIFSFVSALFSIYTYLQVIKHENGNELSQRSWLAASRIGYVLHAFSIFAVFITLFYIISSHYFEYHYAWKHSSIGLKSEYLLSCFWEGSEGSFLLWSFWHAVLGFIILKTGGKLESRVMIVVLIVQALLSTLQMGIYIGDVKIGASAFTLLRNEIEAPIFSQANYLEFVKDGNGLNALLQNYWMVIHPPILFLGFGLTLFPFAYAIAALWKGDYKLWIKPALRWSLATGAILGTGIMMGGAWAYEALSFGGYWAWDPVENASLVPWLIAIAGLHTLVIYKSTGRSLKMTLIFFALTYIFIWYSTFLTRTGILGSTSVHSFTGEGGSLKAHILITIAVILFGSIAFLAKNWKKMPHVAGEEETNSREFWMLIGSIFLLISSVQIIFATSLPVWAPLYKSIMGTDIAPPLDTITYYNDRQVWFAIIIAILTGLAQYFKYKKTDWKSFLKINGLIVVAALLITIPIVMQAKIAHMQYMVFLFASMYAIIGNLTYIFLGNKGKIGKAGASISHLGFGLMLFGILFSSYKKAVISNDITGRVIDFGKETFEENASESRSNVLVFRNTTVPMGDYMVTYLGDSLVNNDPPITYYKVRFERFDPKTKALVESFILYPDAFVNPKGQEGIQANPDARHYWDKDVFIYLTSISDPKAKSDTSAYYPHTVKEGDSIFVANGYFVFEGVKPEIHNKNYERKTGDVPAGLKISGYDIQGKVGEINPVFYIRDNQINTIPDTLTALGTYINIDKINPEDGSVVLNIRQRSQQDDYIVMKALEFPYIRIMWLGIIVMIFGFTISWFVRRNR